MLNARGKESIVGRCGFSSKVVVKEGVVTNYGRNYQFAVKSFFNLLPGSVSVSTFLKSLLSPW